MLVRGESGSGKEAIARAVHTNSPRRAHPFVKVDCAALPAQLIEDELFGHERGAFTGADQAADGMVQAADSGTLFLDEVGELPLSVQGTLLRLLQDRTYVRVGGTQPRTVDVRFVCATHRDLEAEVAAGRLRQDLYYRLRVVQIVVPPLRDRGAADLDPLIDHFLYEFTRTHRRRGLDLSLTARVALHAHHWPGNVRELKNCIESAVVLAAGRSIETDGLSIFEGQRPTTAPERPTATGNNDAFTSGIHSLRTVEKAYVAHVLAQRGGNRSEAARALGIGRDTLLHKIKDA
ncbi:MAG: Nif-specific regulatory protein [Bradymonadia bacterium]